MKSKLFNSKLKNNEVFEFEQEGNKIPFKKLNIKPNTFKIPKMNGRKGQTGWTGLMVGLLFAFMIVTLLISLLPGFADIIDYGKSSESLNCKGYVDSDTSDGNQSYNSTMGTRSSIGCLALTLYLPYLVLGVLVGVISKLLYDRAAGSSYPGY